MARAIFRDARFEYVLAEDQHLDKDDPARTVFVCRQLSAREALRVKACTTNSDTDTVGLYSRIGDRIEMLVFLGLCGWRNFMGRDENGDQVAVAFESDPEATAAAQAYLARMDLDTLQEVAAFIYRGCELTADDVGKSDGLSDKPEREAQDPAPPAS